MLIDIRIPPQKMDLEWMEWLVVNHIYFIRVFTKSDGLSKYKIDNYILKYNNTMRINNWNQIPETIITSSIKKIGHDKILNKIIELNNLFQDI